MRDSARQIEDLLAEWCGDEDVLSPEVQAQLLSEHPEHARELKAHFEALDLLATSLERAGTVAPSAPSAPSHLGPYELCESLGSGGMGTVYRARVCEGTDDLAVGRDVAVKLVHPHLLTQKGFFKRFLREAELGRSVEHPNVVRTYDADALIVEGTHHHFLVMEYVEGQTLRELAADLERLPEELCRHIAVEVTRALVAIHEAGIVHRDLKPENVLITADHEVKVMDLGVAKLADQALRLSQTGAFIGSVHYAAPEQFRGRESRIDGRADLHALGVLLYELATGTHPYARDDFGSVMHMVLEEAPRPLGELNPQASPFFEQVVLTLLAKDPDQRFASATELEEVLTEGEESGWWEGRARELRRVTGQPLRRIRIPRETAVYGREAEISRLKEIFDRAKEGDGQVVLLEGEAGIGKTRLMDEFVARLAVDGEDLNWLFASYPPGGAATASGAFSAAYRNHLGDVDLDAAVAEVLPQTPLLVPAFTALLRGDAAPRDTEPLTKDSLQTCFVHATRSLAARRTTIVLIDDLHFAPLDGRALFASLALAVPGHRILLVGTMRPAVPEDWTANVSRLDQATHLQIPRLGGKDLATLLIDAFRSERLAGELALRLLQKSDGNPFFVFEIIRGLREGQFLAQGADGSWHTTRIIEDIQVPSSVLDLVNARVAELTADERNLLDVAACCGFEFDPLVAGDVLGVGRIPVLQAFGFIEKRHRLVRSSGRRFVFDHHQVQEALYNTLSNMLREEYHASIAEVLEARAAAAGRDPEDLDGSLCVDLCQNFLRGGRWEQALRYLDAALTHLEQGYLNDQVIVLADLALAVPDLLCGRERIEVLLRVSGRLDLLGQRTAQEAVLDEARTLAEAVEDKALEGRVLRALGTLLWRAGRPEDASAKFERALAIYREIGDREGEANTLNNLGIVSWYRGGHDEARAHAEGALAIFRGMGDRRGEAIALLNLGLESSAVGRLREARLQLEEGLALVRDVADRLGQAKALVGLGGVLHELGLTGQALAHRERALAMYREMGDRGGEAIALVNLGTSWAELGEMSRARAMLESSHTSCREIDARYPEGYGLLSLAWLTDQEGMTQESRRLTQESLNLRREIGHSDGAADSLLLLGDLERRAGRVAQAKMALQEALALTREQGREAQVAHALALLANLPGGDAAAAEAALEEAGEAGNTPRTRYYLWKATAKPEHLQEAKRLLDYRVEHAPEEYRESMLKNVRLNREIMEAWAEHGEQAVGEGDAG